MEFTQIALVLLVALWSVQVYAGWRQWRYLQRSMAEASRSYTDGYLGIGRSKSRWGSSRIAMLLVGPDLRVRRLQQMGGLSVFARFRDLAGHEGRSLASLRSALQGPGMPKALADAVRCALEQVEAARGRAA